MTATRKVLSVAAGAVVLGFGGWVAGKRATTAPSAGLRDASMFVHAERMLHWG